MPKVVDHVQRRRELAAAVGRVIARDGVAQVSMRTVAAESGWSSGALRHYFTTRDQLLAFACEEVTTEVTARIDAILREAGAGADAAAVRSRLSPAELVALCRRLLLETMPVDETRHTEATISFAFLALGLGEPEIARVRRLQFTGMHHLCLGVAVLLGAAENTPEAEQAARALHTIVDGLSMHVLAGHRTVPEILTALDHELIAVSESGQKRCGGA